MIKNKIRINKIFGAFTIMLIALTFALPASAIIPASIPIKLKLTVEPSNIMVGAKSTVTVTLLDENDKPIMAGDDIPVDFSTTLGDVPSSMIISKGDRSQTTEFTSSVPGIAVISVKSKGLDSDTTSIAVVSNQSITPTLTATLLTTPSPFNATPAPTETSIAVETPEITTPVPTPTPAAPMISPVVIIGVIVLITLYFRKK